MIALGIQVARNLKKKKISKIKKKKHFRMLGRPISNVSIVINIDIIITGVTRRSLQITTDIQ